MQRNCLEAWEAFQSSLLTDYSTIYLKERTSVSLCKLSHKSFSYVLFGSFCIVWFYAAFLCMQWRRGSKHQFHLFAIILLLYYCGKVIVDLVHPYLSQLFYLHLLSMTKNTSCLLSLSLFLNLGWSVYVFFREGGRGGMEHSIVFFCSCHLWFWK